jgi:toxin ParE1/3/4
MPAHSVRVVISRPADRDLQEIWLTIAPDDAAAATRLVRTIGAKINLLGSRPRLGPRRPYIRPAMRALVEGPYLILYETHPDTDDGPIDEVEIVRVVDGRRDLTGLF